MRAIQFFSKKMKQLFFGLLPMVFIAVAFENCSGSFTSLSADKSGNFSFSSILPSMKGPGASPLRRLSNLEYRNSFVDAITQQFSRQNALVKATAILNSENMNGKFSMLPQDIPSVRLGSDQVAAFLSPSRFETYVEIADGVAQMIVQDATTLKAFAGDCAVSDTSISNTSCLDSFIKNFGALTFRRPVSSTEMAELKTGIANWHDLIGRLLVHPRFLSHFEREGRLIGSNGVYQLNPYELEAKLCSVFWKSIPDIQGLAIAASGALLTEAGVRTEVKRLLASPKAQDVLWIFYQQWFATSRVPKNFDINPTLNLVFRADLTFRYEGLGPQAVQDGKDFLNYITWTSNGKLEDIFRSPLLLASTPDMGKVYGVTPRSSPSDPPIVDSTGHFKGILTRSIISMQKPSVSNEVNHILRGVFVATNLLGIELGSPANFGEQNQAAGQVPVGASTRTEVTVKTSATNCMGCHSTINPSGFALAHYDSLGRYNDVELRQRDGPNGSVNTIATNTIDASTSLNINGKVYTINGADQLVDALFSSGKIYEAFTKYYFRFSFGRTENAINDKPLMDAMKLSLQNQSIKAALESMAVHPDFSRVKAAD